jgi:putative PIN family toxin of toxin-antitoxin system
MGERKIMLKVVIDTNVIISGLLNPVGTPGKILTLAFERKFQPISSEHLLDELRKSLSYPKVLEAFRKTRKAWIERDSMDFIKIFVLFVSLRRIYLCGKQRAKIRMMTGCFQRQKKLALT